MNKYYFFKIIPYPNTSIVATVKISDVFKHFVDGRWIVADEVRIMAYVIPISVTTKSYLITTM